MISVAYVEDDPYLRNFISNFIKEDKDLSLAGVAGSVEDFLKTAAFTPRPDLILQDISLPGMTDLEATQHLKNQFLTS